MNLTMLSCAVPSIAAKELRHKLTGKLNSSPQLCLPQSAVRLWKTQTPRPMMLTLHVSGMFEVLPALLLQVKAASKKKDLKLKFHGAVDHLDDSMHEYKVGYTLPQSNCCQHWCIP